MIPATFTPPSKRQLKPLAQKYGLRFIVLFGSVARGKPRAESDVDVGVYAEKPLTFRRRLKLWLELSKIFRAEIDLTALNHVEPVLGFLISRDGNLLYESKKHAWRNWRSYKIRQYWDTKKFRDDLERYVARRAEEISYA